MGTYARVNLVFYYKRFEKPFALLSAREIFQKMDI